MTKKGLFMEKIEYLTRNEIEKLQSSRLIEEIKYVYENQKPYREKMDTANIKPSDIKSIRDISKLPFTTKHDLLKSHKHSLDKKVGRVCFFALIFVRTYIILCELIYLRGNNQ